MGKVLVVVGRLHAFSSSIASRGSLGSLSSCARQATTLGEDALQTADFSEQVLLLAVQVGVFELLWLFRVLFFDKDRLLPDHGLPELLEVATALSHQGEKLVVSEHDPQDLFVVHILVDRQLLERLVQLPVVFRLQRRKVLLSANLDPHLFLGGDPGSVAVFAEDGGA